MNSGNSKRAEDAVGLWCEITLVTDAKFEGVIYSYNPAQSLLVIMQNDNTKAKVINTRFIKSFDLKEATEEQALPKELDLFATLPSMRAGRGKVLLKYATSTLKDAEQARLDSLGPLQNAKACIGAFDVFVPLKRVFPGVKWDASSNSIKVNETVFVEGNPSWEKPKAVIKDQTKAIRDDETLVERVQKHLNTISQ